MRDFTHIELFAGCGGMNLGLERAGYNLLFANEISPMASETFAYNFFDENLLQLANEKLSPKNTLWIASEYTSENLKDRLRENPFDGKKIYSDLTEDTDVNGKLLVGDIDRLHSFLLKNNKYAELRQMDIDLVSGGPPCQSFSLAGKREKNNAKNLLPLSFAKFAGSVQPKVVLLENVKGITAPFLENGEKYFAWLEVSKAFALEGYFPICMMINSKYFGVPQNRPRFILMAYRKDIFLKLKKKIKNQQSEDIIENTLSFYNKVIDNKKSLDNVMISDLNYYDIESDSIFFNDILLPKPLTMKQNFVTVASAIDDLSKKGVGNSIYISNVNNMFKSTKILNKALNFELRTHNIITQARFRFYQILEELPHNYKKELNSLLTEKESTLIINEVFDQIKKYKFIIPDKELQNISDRKLRSSSELINLITLLKTKKHSQRSLNRNQPAPAQLTIPDDICHYDFNSPRVLTVREMARIQSFPDWFEFRSKVTTGGKMRKYETPQYTQVGNAVPPILSMTLGKLVKNLLNKIEE
ncbi:DNA cytosine methyltransferase [Chryseobacterium shigense]|uniref:Cytosine-specific methyltransferase n=1 Tax=Chryseobacterium shigense TaxID=297244 RepID=A0A841N734_9FLAO|nr:DNA cytosine methyltransferase [Chryseobacterium shigense]MBB6370511.1 DNA (cytosine-5)-methyltransferase 1 [Chryseobacterium shigense]